MWIDIVDASNVKLSNGPIVTATKWTYKQKLSQSGEWSLETPLAEPRLTDATLKRRVHCYVMRPDLGIIWLGGGVIESRGYGMSGQNVPTMNLSGPDLLRELAGVTVNFEIDAAHSAPRATAIFSAIAAAVPSWTINITPGLPEITARFVHESALNALVSTCEKLGCFFWQEPFYKFNDIFTPMPRTITIAKTPVLTTIIATNMADPVSTEGNLDVCLISDVERVETAWDAWNRLIVYGAGDGEARLTLASATAWPDGSTVSSSYSYTDPLGQAHTFALDKTTNTITDSLSVSAYGTYEKAVAFKEIAAITADAADMVAAANTLVAAAVNQLVLSSFPQVTYQLKVAALRQVVHPGMTIQVIARKVRDGIAYIDIDETLIILQVDYEVDATSEKVTGLVVSTSWKPEKTGATLLSEAIQKLTAMEAHPQIGANENTIPFREDVDDDYGAEFPFWMSAGTLQVNSVTLRYKLEKLRSSVKTIGGTASGTVDIPAHTHSVTVANHTHNIPLLGDAASHGLARLVYFNPPDSGLYYDAAGGPAVAVTSSSGGGATVTSASGGGASGIALDISSAITAAYGVFVDPAANYVVTDLDWTINTIPITETPTSIAGGWYEVDITHYMIDATTLRPLAYANAVDVAVKVASHAGKKVRVTAQIELRTTIQTTAAA